MAATYTPQQLGITAPAGGFQQGGWYQGRQYWGGTFSDPNTIHPQSNQQGAGQAVSPEVQAQSAAAQAPAEGAAGGAAAGNLPAGSSYSDVLSSLTGLTPDQQAYVGATQGAIAGYSAEAAGVRSQEPLVRQTYAALADQLLQTEQTDIASAQRIGQTQVGQAEAYLANQGMQQAGGSFAEPVATAQANLQDNITKISQKFAVDSEQLTAQMNQDIATLEQKALDYEQQGRQSEADAVKEVITLKQDQQKMDIEWARLAQGTSQIVTTFNPTTGSYEYAAFNTKTQQITPLSLPPGATTLQRVGTTSTAGASYKINTSAVTTYGVNTLGLTTSDVQSAIQYGQSKGYSQDQIEQLLLQKANSQTTTP